MVKISIFLTDLGGGGAERVMVNLANGLVGKGIEVDLLLVNSEGPYLSKLSPSIRLIEFKTGKLSASIPRLIAYLRQESPDVLITALEDTNLTAIFAHQLARVPTRMIVTVHNNLTQESKYLKSLKRRLVPYLIRWIYPFADLVIAVSQGVAEDLKGLGIRSDKIRVIYNPIITPDFTVAAKAIPAHPWFNSISDANAQDANSQDVKDPAIILGIGRLEPQKDFETLIRAFALVRQERCSKLIILGEGSQRQNLVQLCDQLNLADDVDFLGFIENPLSYMTRVSMCVLSSAWEGFGNVLVESMGVGTPVVSTDCPSGPSEILAGGKYGKLVPVKNAQALAQAIIETLEAPLPAPMLQQRAEDFSLEKVLYEYQKVLLK